MTLPDTGPTRKQRFNAALDLEGITLVEWRTNRFQVSAQHLNEVLNGDRDGGAELNAAIDELIAKHLGDVKNITVARGTSRETSGEAA